MALVLLQMGHIWGPADAAASTEVSGEGQETEACRERRGSSRASSVTGEHRPFERSGGGDPCYGLRINKHCSSDVWQPKTKSFRRMHERLAEEEEYT